MPKIKNNRIFVGFASAGAAGIWSFTRVLKQKGYKIDFYGRSDSKFKMPVDIALRFSTNKMRAGIQNFLYFFKIVSKYDVWHLNCMEAFFFYPLNLLILKLLGKRIILTFRGSEIRLDLDFLPDSLFSKSTNWPPYYLNKHRESRFLRSFRRRLRAKIFIWFADRVALTGPFLASSVGHYDEIIPYARDIKKIVKIPKKVHNGKIIVFHAPSVMEVKGSAYIMEAIKDLKKKYHKLEFRMPLNLSNEDVIREMSRADIVIDQLLVGWYGGQAVEAMALGKPVLSYIHEPYLNLVDFATEIPIVNSNIWTLDKDLEILINSSELRERLGKEGIAFVKKYHRPEKIAEEYLKLYFD